MITHLELDIQECKVRWALGRITMNKARGGDGIPAELFQILKDDAIKVLPSICQQIWKTQQWPQDWKRSVFIPIPKKGNAKECSCSWALYLFLDNYKVIWLMTSEFYLVGKNKNQLLFHMLLKSTLENFEHYFAKVGDEYNCVAVWTFFGIAVLWN